MDRRRVLVVGPGALGVLFATRLADAGHDVTLAARNPKRAKELGDRWTVVDADGHETTATIPCVGRPKDLDSVDLIVLATKAAAAEEAATTWLPKLAPGGALLPLQNGILGDALAQLAGDRLVECTVGIPATLEAPGRSVQTGPGELIIGAWPDARMTPATPLDAVAAVLTDVAPTRIHQNMVGVKWTKLLINSAISGLGVLTGQSLGTLLEDRRARTAFLHIISEGYLAGSAQGVSFERVNRFHPVRFVITKPKKARIATRHAMLRLAARRYKDQRSSSLQSLEKGEGTEIAELNGRIAKEAIRSDLHAPVNEAVQTLVQGIESGRLGPSMDHLDKLPFRYQ